MTFLGLYNKIGKQPVKDTRTSDVTAVFDKEELQKMLNETTGNCISIPLQLKFGNGTQRMWFIKKQKSNK